MTKTNSKRERRQYNKRTDNTNTNPANKTASKVSLKTAVITMATPQNGKFSKALMLSKLDSTTTSASTQQSFYQPQQNGLHLKPPASPKDQFTKTELDQDITEEIDENETDSNNKLDENNSDNEMKPSNLTDVKSDDNLVVKCLISMEKEFLERLKKYLDEKSYLRQLIVKQHQSQNGSPNLDNKSLISANVNLFKQLIFESITCESEAIINWSRTLPDFELLSIDDKATVVEVNFIEILILNIIWRSVIHESDEVKLVLNEDLILSKADCNQLQLSGIYEHLAAVVIKLRRLAISEEEYLSLKALNLLKSDSGIIHMDLIEHCRSKFLKTLRKSTIKASNQLITLGQQQQQQPKIVSHKYRYESYLILLTDIKSISMRLIDYIVTFYTDFNIELPALLKEMLQTQNVMGLTARHYPSLKSHSVEAQPPLLQQQEQQLRENASPLRKDECNADLKKLKNEPTSHMSLNSSSMDDTSDDYMKHS